MTRGIPHLRSERKWDTAQIIQQQQKGLLLRSLDEWATAQIIRQIGYCSNYWTHGLLLRSFDKWATAQIFEHTGY
jgi:hypothetical protein